MDKWPTPYLYTHNNLRMVVVLQACPISSQHVSPWCRLSTTNLVVCISNIGVQLRGVALELTPGFAESSSGSLKSKSNESGCQKSRALSQPPQPNSCIEQTTAFRTVFIMWQQIAFLSSLPMEVDKFWKKVQIQIQIHIYLGSLHARIWIWIWPM